MACRISISTIQLPDAADGVQAPSHCIKIARNCARSGFESYVLASNFQVVWLSEHPSSSFRTLSPTFLSAINPLAPLRSSFCRHLHREKSTLTQPNMDVIVVKKWQRSAFVESLSVFRAAFSTSNRMNPNSDTMVGTSVTSLLYATFPHISYSDAPWRLMGFHPSLIVPELEAIAFLFTSEVNHHIPLFSYCPSPCRWIP
ncbi:hypothetical protein QBC45DRAFT_462691 [Copromyces sp. CBS 386.78]|nr:hypothetical protein QBC45DRAFT_462691 [Copromyces sp. CBS 386.78]